MWFFREVNPSPEGVDIAWHSDIVYLHSIPWLETSAQANVSDNLINKLLFHSRPILQLNLDLPARLSSSFLPFFWDIHCLSECSVAGMCFCNPHPFTKHMCVIYKTGKASEVLTYFCYSLFFPINSQSSAFILLTHSFPSQYSWQYSQAAGNLINKGVSWQILEGES